MNGIILFIKKFIKSTSTIIFLASIAVCDCCKCSEKKQPEWHIGTVSYEKAYELLSARYPVPDIDNSSLESFYNGWHELDTDIGNRIEVQMYNFLKKTNKLNNNSSPIAKDWFDRLSYYFGIVDLLKSNGINCPEDAVPQISKITNDVSFFSTLYRKYIHKQEPLEYNYVNFFRNICMYKMRDYYIEVAVHLPYVLECLEKDKNIIKNNDLFAQFCSFIANEYENLKNTKCTVDLPADDKRLFKIVNTYYKKKIESLYEKLIVQ